MLFQKQNRNVDKNEKMSKISRQNWLKTTIEESKNFNFL